MDFNRAKEIVSSPKEYEVSYNGVSVWIDKLHDDGKTATVHLRRSLEERFEVDVSELKEEYLIH
ncbi:Small acid-soluble spore protein H (Minor) OS=Ureibacillus acetophenoni OX=614649 GN=SAMN05877842_105145 PE=3 SV=1 [Ureibacillus acetophenoni]|uniref:H-type small acid-soluble spore protein n=1 Tax=Ureibacillus sp. MALMAid1270 TaxID=3411629 RepID=UPI003BA4BB21